MDHSPSDDGTVHVRVGRGGADGSAASIEGPFLESNNESMEHELDSGPCDDGDVSMGQEEQYQPHNESSGQIDIDAECNHTDKLRKLISSLGALQTRIDEAIAFPTAKNFKKMHHQGSSTHRLFSQVSQVVEFGDVSRNDDTKVVDDGMRTKLSSFGTNMWLNVQNYPEVFRDFVSSSSSPTTTITPSTLRPSGAAPAQDERYTSDPMKAQEIELEKERAAASGYVRSLACRLILISKIQTKRLIVPKLVQKQIPVEKGVDSALLVPLAMSGELEFAFKCLCRAGKAMLHFSSVLFSSSLPDEYDPSAAFTTLLLALAFWEGIEQVHRSNDDNGKRCLFIDEAYDAMLLLPDCATLLSMNDAENEIDKGGNDAAVLESRQDNETVNVVLVQLKRLEDFVNNQVSIGEKYQSNELKSIQHFLPSLARTSYKHGNRFARLSDFGSSREALRVALCATDKNLAMITERLESKDQANCLSENAKRSFQIQQQEMLVLSKQCFYVLSHVCKSLGKIEEARKCLDRIELYIDAQMQKDSEQYKDSMKRITKAENRESDSFGSVSGFALEGPKKQDIAEIKTRLTAAQAKSKSGEMMERLNLAYSRIMICANSIATTDVETDELIDTQFQLMTHLVKDSESKLDISKKLDPHPSADSYASPYKQRDAFQLTLSAARVIFIRRKDRYETNDQFQDPYKCLVSLYPKGHEKNLLIHLDLLNTLLVVAQDLKGTNVDQHALEIGKKVVSQLAMLMNDIQNKGATGLVESTLFSSTKEASDSDIGQLLDNTREYFTRAVSMYYSSNDGHDKTVEWCNLLIELIRTSQQFSCTHEKEAKPQDCCDRVISGVMSTKALSLSMTNSHGAALKTAREAWDKYAAEIGNLVTLFHCSIHYEAFSDSNECCTGTFENSLLELDSAISTFVSISKITDFAKSSYDHLLEAFPVLCNSAIQIEKSKTGPLLLGLQKRYIDILVSIAAAKVANTNTLNSNGSASGESNVFSLLCSYLANFDTILTSSDYQLSDKWCLLQLQNLQNTLDNVLRLLVAVRDQDYGSNDSDDSLTKFAKSFQEIQPPSDLKTVLLLESGEKACQFIGTSADCLWIGEQIWNIATQIISKVSKESTTVKGSPGPSHRLHAADLFSKAHDFALFSEEEVGAFLTKGYLACEDFDGKQYEEKTIDFTSKVKLASTDICSEFSAQCLLLQVAHVVDHYMNEEMPLKNNHMDYISTGTDQLLSSAMNSLVATMSEMQVIESDINEELVQQVKWLALTLLIFLKDDAFCSKILTKHGLLTQIEGAIMSETIDCSNINDINHHPLNRIIHLIHIAENIGMNESTKALLTLCSKWSLQTGSDIENNRPSFSIGIVQRKIIHLSSRVEEVVNVFTEIDDHVQNFCQDKTISSTKANDEKLYPYNKKDFDYFVIEAYNRAVRLLYIGDFVNAEKLLAVALNLLPHSGKEVECHGGEIRKVYRGVIQRRCNDGTCSISSMLSDSMVTLFQG